MLKKMIRFLDKNGFHSQDYTIYGEKWWPKRETDMSDLDNNLELFMSAKEYGVIVVNTINEKKSNGDEFAVYQFVYKILSQSLSDIQDTQDDYRTAEMPASEFRKFFVKGDYAIG